MTNEIIPHNTVESLVSLFNETAREIKESYAKLYQAEESLNRICNPQYRLRISASRCDRYSTDFSPQGADYAIERLERDVWRLIVERLELRRIMSSERFAALDKELDKGTLPKITQENVFSFVQGHLNALEDLFTENVREVFDWLRPRRDEYKTNKRETVGSKVILTYAVENGWSTKYRVCIHTQKRLSAIESVFSALEGKGVVDKTYYSVLQTEIEKSTGVGETPLFKFRCCKNGNLHLQFKRLDLLKKFNTIAGGPRLPSGKEKD